LKNTIKKLEQKNYLLPWREYD